MSDLVEFLRARLNEDEARWKHGGEHTYGHTDACSWWGDMPGYCDCNGHDRVLREVEAKRRILTKHSGPDMWDSPDYHLCYDEMTHNDDCDTLQALASIYADHPDFRDEWR